MNDGSAIFSNTLHTAAIAGLEITINKALELDPATLKKLQVLDNHVFLLHCSAPELSLYAMVDTNTLRLYSHYEHKADTTLTGSAQEFAKLATANDPASALINGELALHGDSQALITLQKILKELDIDWEAPLATLFGDVVGHQLGRNLRQGMRFGLQALRGFKRQLDEYIVEESDLAPQTSQVEHFFTEIDQLSLRTERLQAKLQKLQQHFRSHK